VLVALAGCGEDSTNESRQKGPVPQSLLTLESASRNVIELALAGKRRAVIREASVVAAAGRHFAKTPVAKDGFPGALKWQTARVRRLASSAPLLKVAMAANRAFQSLPYFFQQSGMSVVSDTSWLRYIEYQTLLSAKARNARRVHIAVVALRRNWEVTRPDVRDERIVARFDEHVRSMTRLGDNSDPALTQREAKRGLDHIDELERALEAS
jgi:hypothetical protein